KDGRKSRVDWTEWVRENNDHPHVDDVGKADLWTYSRRWTTFMAYGKKRETYPRYRKIFTKCTWRYRNGVPTFQSFPTYDHFRKLYDRTDSRSKENERGSTENIN